MSSSTSCSSGSVSATTSNGSTHGTSLGSIPHLFASLLTHPSLPLTIRCDAHASLYEKQFSKPAAGGLTQDGYSDFFLFSTGRRLVASLHTIFTLRPRHDLAQTLYQVIRELVQLTWVPQDEIQLDFKLHSDVVLPEFVWALVSKNELISIQQERWDLVSGHLLFFSSNVAQNI